MPLPTTSAPRRPVLRYHGGKWRLAPWIIGHFPAHRVYVEPFGGAASVLMRKPRSTVEVVNDLNNRVVSFFRVVRDKKSNAELARLLRLTPYSKTEYLDCRSVSDDPVEDARRLLVLSFQGHGSTGACGGQLTGWRRGDRGTRSTSSMDWVGLVEHIPFWCDRLQGVFLDCDDAIAIIRRYDSIDTLFYVDPPYLPSTRHRGPRAYAHEMSEADHVHLAEVLNSVTGKVVLSGYESDLYDHLYPDWDKVHRMVRTDKSLTSTEVLWLSPGAGQHELPLFSTS